MTDTARIDIGHGIEAALRLSKGLPGIDDGIVVGVLLTHPCAKRGGQRTEDFIPVLSPLASFDPWTLVARDPLTLKPSVHWTCCGLHGWVAAGKWVPA